MSFSAKIDSNILCLHVGISDLLVDSSHIKRLPRIYHSFSNKLINDIFWSDYLNIIKFQDPCCCAECCFGKALLEKFIADNHLNLLARVHQCVSDGNYTHGGKYSTFFSAFNHCELFQDKSSFLIIHSEKKEKSKTSKQLSI
jgi:serine/threonine-protein phosphatase PP1 catalytic subunit